MGFLKKWFIALVLVQGCLFVARRSTTEYKHALLTRISELFCLQFAMALGSWLFLTKRLNFECGAHNGKFEEIPRIEDHQRRSQRQSLKQSLSLKTKSTTRWLSRGIFVCIALAAHIAYIFFYVDIAEDSYLVWTCFVCVAFYIHLMIISFGFFILEQICKRLLPERFNIPIFTSSTYHTAYAVFIALLFTTYGIATTRSLPTVRAVDVSIDNLPQRFDGFSIALLTDIHIGPTVTKKRVEDIVQIVNGLNVDSVAIVGDLVDGFLQHIRYKALPLKNLTAKSGKFYATGNHEYYHGDINPLIQFLRNDLNLSVLHNEHAVVERDGGSICFTGVDDIKSLSLLIKGHAMDPEKAISGCPQNNTSIIMLVHQPNAAAKIIKSTSRKIDLILSGHTHAGQFYVTWPLAWIQNSFLHGLYRDIKSGTQVYVSAGVHFWGPPIKARNLCEIILLRLRAGQSAH